jgi:hypothetical protein
MCVCASFDPTTGSADERRICTFVCICVCIFEKFTILMFQGNYYLRIYACMYAKCTYTNMHGYLSRILTAVHYTLQSVHYTRVSTKLRIFVCLLKRLSLLQSMYVCMHACVCVCVCVCVCKHICICIHTHIHVLSNIRELSPFVCMLSPLYIRVCVCESAHVYIHTYIHTYIYIMCVCM